jgi:two-component system, OmpR family, copper resistance phosphate regulon response regulator CusR
MRLLLVEDERRIATYVRKGLEEQGHAVDQAFDGHEALSWVKTNEFDVIILDLMLPQLDGLGVCRRMRQNSIRTPILMLTARDTVEDRISGLDAGADDYLVKPFAMGELLARVRALGRRHAGDVDSSELRVADLVLDPARHVASRAGRSVELTAKEFAILEYLMRETDRVCTRTVIAEHVWNYDVFTQSNVVDVYIRNLRRKVDDEHEMKLIHTIRGVGYRITAEGDNDPA